jgi:hypothetical protein
VRGRAALAAALLLGTSTVAGQAPASAPSRTHLVLVVGAAGEPQFGDAFHRAATAIDSAARARFGIPAADVVWLADDTTRARGRIAGRSTRENVERVLGDVARRAAPGDQVWLVLVGHGSSEGEASRFNLPGPDLTAADFARLLAPLARQTVAVVNAASASADFAKTLAGPNRAIVTATRSPSERNVTRFADHFAAALARPNADLDKDGGVSLLEAFTFAQRETARSYETQNRLQTEHAQLEDDGDGKASDKPATDAADGRLAASLVLGGVPASSDPRMGPLVAKRRALELQVADLRRRRASLDSTAYWTQMETVLVDLARTSRTIRGMGEVRP